MTAWDIDPAGVHGVVTATEGVAGEFETHTTALNGGLDGAAAESASGIVAGAVTAFGAAAAGDLAFVHTRTGACISAATQATAAYVAGDEQMAANAQSAAASAPDPSAIMPGRGAR